MLQSDVFMRRGPSAAHFRIRFGLSGHLFFN